MRLKIVLDKQEEEDMKKCQGDHNDKIAKRMNLLLQRHKQEYDNLCGKLKKSMEEKIKQRNNEHFK